MWILAAAALAVGAFASRTDAESAPVGSEEVNLERTVLPLPGQLDSIPVFNSNSPEVVNSEGILLSTFGAAGKKYPGAHLSYPLEGRFDIFLHHINNALKRADKRTLHIALLVGNAGSKPVTVKVLQASSYLSQPDAPFVSLPGVEEDRDGTIFAGPGDRVMSDFLRGKSTLESARSLVIDPGAIALLVDLPVPVRSLAPPINGRSALIKLQSNGPVEIASLAKFDAALDGPDGAPSLAQWKDLLASGNLAGPRDVSPTEPQSNGPIKYGRVSGVARGSRWQAVLTNTTEGNKRRLEMRGGDTLSYVLSTVDRGTLGTAQIQSAPLLVRYPDTAYKAHGNYAVLYDLTLPLSNPSQENETISVSLQSPLKESDGGHSLKFLDHPSAKVFFRGSINLRYKSDSGKTMNQYFHLVQNRGELSKPLVKLRLGPKKRKTISLRFFYPPDATPPQVLTLEAQKL